MTGCRFAFTTLTLLLLIQGSRALADTESLITTERVSDRVLALRVGVTYFDQIVALSSRDGLVVIDTGISPSLTMEYRRIIEREFGRNDFAYVINTHHHSDHTFGNQVFSDARIVGHHLCPDGMRQEKKAIPDKITSRRARVSEFREQLSALDPDSPQGRQLRSGIHFLAKSCDDLESGIVLTPPSMTFSDRMTIYMGDLTLRLTFFGTGFHTDNDILVHVPEEGLLFTGDLFSFSSEVSTRLPEGDLSRWIDVLEEILQDEKGVRRVVTSHFGIFPRERLTAKLRELKSLKKNAGP